MASVLADEINLRRPSVRAREVSSASVAHAIRRGSVKISWPIPADEDERTLVPAPQRTSAVTASGPAAAQPGRGPVRPPRGAGPASTSTPARTQADVDTPSNPRSTGHGPYGEDLPSQGSAQQTTPSALAGTRLPQASRPADGRGETVDRPKRRGDSVRSVIRRLLRRSTVKDDRAKGPSRRSGNEAQRSGHHRSVRVASPCEPEPGLTAPQDPSALTAMAGGEPSRRNAQRSTSLPIKELTTVRPSISPPPPRRRAMPGEQMPEHDGVTVPGLSSSDQPWQRTSPHAPRQDEDRPWQSTSPNARWNDATGAPTWTGLAPRPASSYARRGGSLSPSLRPEEIGLALAHPGNPRRRSRSAGELKKTSHRLARAYPERRMSEEIRYWRESLSAQPLSPLSHEKARAELLAPSRPTSYENGTIETEPRSLPEGRFSNGLPVTEVAALRVRVAELEAKVWHLQTAMAEIHRYLCDRHEGEGEAGVPDVLGQVLFRRSGESFSVAPKATMGRRPQGLAMPGGGGLSIRGVEEGSPRGSSIERRSLSGPSTSKLGDRGVSKLDERLAGRPLVPRSLSTTTTTTTTTTTARRSVSEGLERPPTVIMGGMHSPVSQLVVVGPDRATAEQRSMNVSEEDRAVQEKEKTEFEPGGDEPMSGPGPSEHHDVDQEGDDKHEDDEYLTTSESFITPTEDKTFGQVSPSSSSSSSSSSSLAGNKAVERHDDDTTWASKPSASSTATTAAVAAVTATRAPTSLSSPASSAHHEPEDDEHEEATPQGGASGERTLSLSQLTHLPPPTTSTAPPPPPMTRF